MLDKDSKIEGDGNGSEPVTRAAGKTFRPVFPGTHTPGINYGKIRFLDSEKPPESPLGERLRDPKNKQLITDTSALFDENWLNHGFTSGTGEAGIRTPFVEDMIARLKRRVDGMPKRRSIRFTEVGCGGAEQSLYMAQKLHADTGRSIEVIVIDTSEAAMEVLKRNIDEARLDRKINFTSRQGDMFEAIAWPDDPLLDQDLVFGNAAFHFAGRSLRMETYEALHKLGVLGSQAILGTTFKTTQDALARRGEAVDGNTVGPLIKDEIDGITRQFVRGNSGAQTLQTEMELSGLKTPQGGPAIQTPFSVMDYNVKGQNAWFQPLIMKAPKTDS